MVKTQQLELTYLKGIKAQKDGHMNIILYFAVYYYVIPGNILLLKPWHILILVLIHNDFLIQSGPFIFRAPEMHN